MDTQRILLGVLLGGFFLVGIYAIIYCRTSHFKCESMERLKRDAKVIDMKFGIIGERQGKKIRTVVFFDDGSQFISHKTNRQDHVLSYTIALDTKTKMEILQDAVAAHQKAIEDYEKKRRK